MENIERRGISSQNARQRQSSDVQVKGTPARMLINGKARTFESKELVAAVEAEFASHARQKKWREIFGGRESIRSGYYSFPEVGLGGIKIGSCLEKLLENVFLIISLILYLERFQRALGDALPLSPKTFKSA
jgi:hypothetical protein